MLMLFSQWPYLKKRGKKQKIQEKGFQKTHLANGVSFSDEDLSALYDTWFAYGMSFAEFYIPCIAVALFGEQLLARSIGGAFGNFSAVALILAGSIVAFILSRTRKKRYQAYLDKLGLTEKDIRQALLHKKQETVAVAIINKKK